MTSTLNNSDPLAFPPITDAYVGAAAIVTNGGSHHGCRLLVGKRVLTGSWKRKDGTRGEHYSRWVKYQCAHAAHARSGWSLLPERELMVCCTWAMVSRRRTLERVEARKVSVAA